MEIEFSWLGSCFKRCTNNARRGIELMDRDDVADIHGLSDFYHLFLLFHGLEKKLRRRNSSLSLRRPNILKRVCVA